MINRILSRAMCWSAALFCLCVGAQAQETGFVKISVGSDGRVRLEVPSSTDHYYVLYYRRDADDPQTEIPIAMQLGDALTTVLTEPLEVAPSSGLYRVETFRIDEPGDVDGDERNDVEEFTDTSGRLSPINPADPIAFVDGATRVLDRQMYRDLSYQGLDVL